MKQLILIAALALLTACEPPAAPTGPGEPQPPREEEQCGPDEVCAYP